eukprot:m.26234 g.26234  ORF g.26234 m.26234 type:complete len:456 (-) comp7778_c0_seq2:2170-3537(-)
MSAPTSTVSVPSRPTLSVKPDALDATTVASIAKEVEDEAKSREAVFQEARALSRQGMLATHSILSAKDCDEALTACEASVPKVITALKSLPQNGCVLRNQGSVSAAIEQYVAAKCLHSFLTTGKMLPRGFFEAVTGDEYLSGSIRFCQDLERYAVGRATCLDANSVLICRDLVQDFFEILLEFDFRNGPLRRRFDGVKYVHRRMEDLLYELSLTGTYQAESEEEGRKAKKRKLSEGFTSVRINAQDFVTLKENMDRYDKKREEVIKKTRDVQKLSKQAIFSLHRDNMKQASEQLDRAVSIAQTIFEGYVKDEPLLRVGSYSNAMEEFAEAVLFKEWLTSKQVIGIQAEQFKGLINTSEYCGGLGDFTGEVGRFAVVAASRRNEKAVMEALAADLAVQDFFLALGSPPRFSKKEQAIRTNIKKVEHLAYEVSLVKATGRQVKASEATEPPAEKNDS